MGAVSGVAVITTGRGVSVSTGAAPLRMRRRRAWESEVGVGPTGDGSVTGRSGVGEGAGVHVGVGGSTSLGGLRGACEAVGVGGAAVGRAAGEPGKESHGAPPGSAGEPLWGDAGEAGAAAGAGSVLDGAGRPRSGRHGSGARPAPGPARRSRGAWESPLPEAEEEAA